MGKFDAKEWFIFGVKMNALIWLEMALVVGAILAALVFIGGQIGLFGSL